MALDLEEQEQLDELKAWWKQNGKWIIAGVVAFLLATAGWRVWQSWTVKQGAEASALFEKAMQAAAMNDGKALKDATAQLMENYPRSGYAAPAAWLAGRVNHQMGDGKSARAQYEFALEHAKDEGVKQLARLRLAAILMDAKDFGGAMAQLNQEPAPAFAGLHADLKGDVLQAQGKTAEAREAYKQAIEKLGDKSALKPLVEIKLDGLGG
ncbi:MAG TPA: tetratricopeptide repeat protein [Thiobacillaceae bacterium]|nr:tetratricopeptide repeat protein [Thiobacillaceae bacterium]